MRALGHLWSLACEMQFYLLAPILYLIGERTRIRRSFFFVPVAAILVFTGVFYASRMNTLEIVRYHFEVSVWPMMLGFCCECYKKKIFLFSQTVVRAVLIAGGFLLAASLLVMLLGVEMKKPVIAIGAVMLLPCFLSYREGVCLEGFAGKALAWLGERTYSIYLWQQPLTICNFLPAMVRPIGALAAIGVGGLWFNWFEKPFLSGGRAKLAEPEKVGV